MSIYDYALTEEEIARLSEMAGFSIVIDEAKKPAQPSVNPLANDEYAGELIKDMVNAYLEKGPEGFLSFVYGHNDLVMQTASFNEDVKEALITCYKMGISDENGGCANDLGALYCKGELVEQDYAKAAELYEMAMDWGCYQSIINLGYIYEYGRIGEPDYQKAYQYYSLAAALQPHYEALYKLGDMYSRGKVMPQDIEKAYALWSRSMDLAEGIEEQAQAAIRIAPLLLDDANQIYGIEYNPMLALHLYQVAEVGLRLAIQHGYYYYEKRLQEALEGQEKARFKVECPDLR